MGIKGCGIEGEKPPCAPEFPRKFPESSPAGARAKAFEALHHGRVMRRPLERQQRLDPGITAGDHVGLAAVAVVRNQRVHLAQHRRQRHNLLQRGHDFALVVGRLAHMPGDHQHRLGVHAGLGVVALLEAAARHGHDARLLIREVDLVAAPGTRLGRLGVLAAGFLARVALGLALGLLGLELLLLRLEAFGCALRDLGLGLRNGSEAILPPGDLGGHIHAVGRAGAIARLRQCQ